MILGRNINDLIHRIFPPDPLAARPNVYFGLEWLVVPLVIVCDLGAQAAYRDTFFFRPAYGAGS